MRLFLFFSLFVFSYCYSQKKIAIDSTVLKNASSILSDDYGNIYLYKKTDLSFTKFDSLGNQLAKTMLPLPYKIQNISNPLTIIMFSDNTQDIQFLDQNLNITQRIKLNNGFGFITSAYVEDLQFAWLIDDSYKTINQYNYRTNTKIISFPINIDTQNIIDFMVYQQRFYILRPNQLEVYNSKLNLLETITCDSCKRIKRINNSILIITDNSIQLVDGKNLEKLFYNINAKIVDKNSSGFLALIKDKLYLYPQKSTKAIQKLND